MHREYVKWFSARLHRDMEILVFGHAGPPVLVFPTSQGRFYEWEDHGMVGALHEKLEHGQVQLYCVDSIDAESWYARWKHPADRVWKHQDYDHYLCHEVAPFIRSRNQHPRFTAAGASLGAYHAVNFALRHPDIVRYTVTMSGAYSVPEVFLDGYYDENTYFHAPLDNLLGLNDPWFLSQLRQNFFLLVCGRDDRFMGENWDLAHKLGAKSIPNRAEVWDGWCHDWPYWQPMARMFL
ncbi:MAG: alpha/beta hydrolase-fold protein [Bryobacterales bacterium]|jgi:esterase/lipase superfamily enzyme|nr:alpha/beta hydrolase-fold protein [Bryobacterales bacterium]